MQLLERFSHAGIRRTNTLYIQPFPLGEVRRFSEPADGLAVLVFVGQNHTLVHQQIICVARTVLAILLHFPVICLDSGEWFLARIGANQVVQDTVHETPVAQLARPGQCLAVERVATLKVVERTVNVPHHVVHLWKENVETVFLTHFQAVQVILHGFGIRTVGITDVADVAQCFGTGMEVVGILASGSAPGEHIEGRKGELFIVSP